MNWYAYVRNNPLKYTDPTGLYLHGGDDNGESYQKYAENKYSQENGGNPGGGPTTTTVTVQKGDNTWNLMMEHAGEGWTTGDVAKLNPHIKDIATIYTGDTITIPTSPKSGTVTDRSHSWGYSSGPRSINSPDNGKPGGSTPKKGGGRSKDELIDELKQLALTIYDSRKPDDFDISETAKTFANHFTKKADNIGYVFDFYFEFFYMPKRNWSTDRIEQALTTNALISLFYKVVISRATYQAYGEINNILNEQFDRTVAGEIWAWMPKDSLLGKGIGFASNKVLNSLIGGGFGIATLGASQMGKVMKLAKKLNKMGITHKHIDSVNNAFSNTVFINQFTENVFHLQKGDNSMLATKIITPTQTVYFWYSENQGIERVEFFNN